MLTYTIQCVNKVKKQIAFFAVEGYKLPNGLATHKNLEKKSWVLDDLNSGCLVQGDFPTFSNVKATLENSDLLNRVFERRKSKRYAELVKRNRDYNEAKREELEQESLW